MRATLFLPVLAALLTCILAGCSQGDANAPTPPPSSPAHAATAATAATGAVPPTAPAATTNSSQAADSPSVTATEKPFEAYMAPDHDGLRWVGLYYAVTGAPIDAAAVANRLDPAYQRATDAFAKRDALTAVQAKLQQAIDQAKANPYVRLPPVVTHMPTFDIDRGRYDFSDLIGEGRGMHLGDTGAQVRFAPSPGLTGYAPANVAEARVLEHTLGSNPLGRQIQMTVYGKVIGGTLMSGEPQLLVAPSRVVLENFYVDGHTTPLLTATVSP